ncbi:MAG: hypothetical protein K6T81_09230 [Alicyclobacillus macrosporangiidus]|uniref:hypothetical protein n=1 Tax=Alicyclobacillus macrosporangiidus TaxID=392015 RepID=UPI0026EC97AF|nr:hypothetical protein [Alicyclobacillus macrosporangiidus]MCL6598912.1 hypothetical protein [Alicyclobacillus macrosporangiidus]
MRRSKAPKGMNMDDAELQAFLKRLDTMDKAVYDAALGLISGGDLSTEIACPLCGDKALVRLDFCCGVEADCLSSTCDFFMHMNLGLNFDAQGVNRTWPFKPFTLRDYTEVHVIPVATPVWTGGEMNVVGYGLTVFRGERDSYLVHECETLGEAFRLRDRFASAYTSLLDQGFVFRQGVLVGRDGTRVPLQSLVS